MITDVGKYYLYRHVRLDKNEVFYVGIGTKRSRDPEFTINYERANTAINRNNIWKQIVKKADYKVQIILESYDYSFIKSKEIEFITTYGLICKKTGTLANLTYGGEGTFGVKQTEEHVEKRTSQIRGKPRAQKTKDKISEAHKGRKHSQEFCDNMSKVRLGKKYTEFHKIKISNGLKGKPKSQASIENRLKTILPLEKILSIKNMLERGLFKNDVCKLKQVGFPTVNKIIEQFKIPRKFLYKREDGVCFYTETDACKSVGLSPGRVGCVADSNIRAGKFLWKKVIPDYTIQELHALGKDSKPKKLRRSEPYKMTSRYLGVSKTFYTSGKPRWRVSLEVKGVRYGGKSFSNEKLAAMEYNRLATLYLGDKAILNKI